MAKRNLGVNHMTLEKKTIYNYGEALDEPCRIVFVKVCEVLLKGTPLFDKYDKLPGAQKRRFNPDQKEKITNRLPVKDMDISLLELIINVFGDLGCSVGPTCLLLHSCKELKVCRNTFAHEKPILSLTREQLKEELKKLRDICEQILEELKNYCDHDASLIPSLDPLMNDIDDELQSLEKIEWEDSDIRKSALKELKSFLDKKCLIDTAEGYDGSHQDILANAKEGSRPKTMEKGRSDINSINPDDILANAKEGSRPKTMEKGRSDINSINLDDILANAKEGSRPKTMEKGRSDINSINPDMSWDKYVSDQLLATGNVQKGAICGLDGSLWAVSDGWGVQAPEIIGLANAFKDPSPLHQKGIVIAGVKYMFLSATDEVLRGRKIDGGVHIAKTNTAMIIGYYEDPVKPGQCAATVEALSDNLKGVNY